MYLSDFKHISAFEQLLSACLLLCQMGGMGNGNESDVQNDPLGKNEGDVEAKGAAYST